MPKTQPSHPTAVYHHRDVPYTPVRYSDVPESSPIGTKIALSDDASVDALLVELVESAYLPRGHGSTGPSLTRPTQYQLTPERRESTTPSFGAAHGPSPQLVCEAENDSLTDSALVPDDLDRLVEQELVDRLIRETRVTDILAGKGDDSDVPHGRRAAARGSDEALADGPFVKVYRPVARHCGGGVGGDDGGSKEYGAAENLQSRPSLFAMPAQNPHEFAGA